MIFNMVGGGGGSGATLVVSSPANVSVTVSKDDKSYTKNSGSLGSTTFKGLATGTWTVVISGNGQTATKTIEITADYAITIAFFSASINITYPANSTCVVTNSSGQTVASDTNTGSSTKTWTATVNATGTYTVTATATDGSGKSKSQSVSITEEGQDERVTLSYKLVLFDNGSYAAETGGFTGISNDKLYTQNTGFGGEFTYSPWYSNNAVDITGYSTLKFTVEKGGATGDANNYNLLDVGITKTKGASDTNDLAAKVSVRDNAATADKEYTLDISDFSGTYYIEGISQGADWTSEAKVTWSNTLRVELS